MALNQTPHPMPMQMRDRLLTEFAVGPLDDVGDEAQYSIRQLVADAYAEGFAAGRLDESLFRMAQ